MNDRMLTPADIEREHLAQVRPPWQWAYLIGVLGGGGLVMLAMIAALGQAA